MATAFIGLTIIVTLKSPPNTIVQGLVANVVEQTSTLILQDVLFPASGRRMQTWSIEGAQIADLKLLDAPAPAPIEASHDMPQSYEQHINPVPPSEVPKTIRHEAPTPTPTQPQQPFVDPAILSYGKKPPVPGSPLRAVATTAVKSLLPQNSLSTPIKSAASSQLPTNISPYVGVPQPNTESVKKPGPDVTATLTAPFSGIGLDAGEAVDDTDDPTITGDGVRRASVTKTRTGKPMDTPEGGADSQRKKRPRNKSRRKETALQKVLVPNRAVAEVETSPEMVRNAASGTGGIRGDGWRQTPILQDHPSNMPRTPGIISGKVGRQAVTASNRKNKKQRAIDATNGWATEDATDVQEMPEFDFAENLSKFDKQTVFDQIRNEDTTADEDRLVSFNRLPARLGTFGGQKLHPTENVLDDGKVRRRSIATSDTDDDFDFDSGRNSRRAMSRASIKRQPHRSNSGMQEDGAPAINASASSLLNRSFNRPVYSSSHATGSPRPGRFTPPESPAGDRPANQGYLRLMSTNQPCPTIAPGSMAAIEEVAEVEFGLTEDIMAENAARGIAEVALLALNPGGRRLARENAHLNARPVIVVLAGNHKAGSRAIAAARQLAARGPRVVACVLGLDRGGQADFDREVRRQLELFRRFGGVARGWADVSRYLKKLDAPPELIVDALLVAPKRDFEALGPEDRTVALEMVGWANKSRAQVLSVDAPSGVNGSTGEISILEGEPLEVRAKFIVCIGAPRTGLLRALQSGEGAGWQLWVVDVGVNRVWKQHGPRGSKGVGFGGEWVAPLRFVLEEGEGR